MNFNRSFHQGKEPFGWFMLKSFHTRRPVLIFKWPHVLDYIESTHTYTPTAAAPVFVAQINTPRLWTHTILTAEEIISCHQKYGTNTGGITEDLWPSFSTKFTEAELMKNRLSICQPWAGSQTQNLTVRMKYCVKYSGADALPRSVLVFTLCLPLCSLSHFQPDMSLSSRCPPSISFCSILPLQCCRELLSFNLATYFTKKKSKEKKTKGWGQSESRDYKDGWKDITQLELMFCWFLENSAY